MEYWHFSRTSIDLFRIHKAVCPHSCLEIIPKLHPLARLRNPGPAVEPVGAVLEHFVAIC